MTLRDYIRRMIVRRWQLELDRDALIVVGALALGLLIVGAAIAGAAFLPPHWRGR